MRKSAFAAGLLYSTRFRTGLMRNTLRYSDQVRIGHDF
jgi:hypothetical protein